MATKQETEEHGSKWNKLKRVVQANDAFRRVAADGRADERLSARIERALKTIGLNDNAGLALDNDCREYHVILAGPNRGGKATLTSSLCGQPVNAVTRVLQDQAEEFKCLQKISQRKGFPHTVTFWHTTGASNWDKDKIKSRIEKIAQIHSPIFLLFCISPSNTIVKGKVAWLIESCIEENLFIALVRTNIYEKSRFNFSLDALNTEVTAGSVADGPLKAVKSDPSEPFGSKTTFYYQNGKTRPVALTCEVNSIEHKGSNASEPATGVSELILAIMKSIPDEKLQEMIYVVLNNRDFWADIDSTFSAGWNEKFVGNFRTWYEQCTKR